MRHTIRHYHKLRHILLSYMFTYFHDVVKSGCDETDFEYHELSVAMR